MDPTEPQLPADEERFEFGVVSATLADQNSLIDQIDTKLAAVIAATAGAMYFFSNTARSNWDALIAVLFIVPLVISLMAFQPRKWRGIGPEGFLKTFVHYPSETRQTAIEEMVNAHRANIEPLERKGFLLQLAIWLAGSLSALAIVVKAIERVLNTPQNATMSLNYAGFSFSDSQLINDVLYLGLLIVAIFTAIANLRSAAAADKLYKFQESESRIREERQRPSLRLFDEYMDNKELRQKGIFSIQTHVDVMNFGARPARIRGATIVAGGQRYAAEFRSTSVVKPGYIARIVIKPGIIKAAFGASLDQAVDDPSRQEGLALTGDLELTYSETFESDVQLEHIPIRLYPYRAKTAGTQLDLVVLKAEDAEGEGIR